MDVLITGGTGFIGSRLALSCLAKGDSVKVLGQENTHVEAENKRLLDKQGAQVILASVTDKHRLFKELSGVEVVYHLAAAQHEADVPDQRFWDVNVTGTRNILEASVKAGVKRFVHGSTIGVYGSGLEGTLHESSLLKPDNIYGVTKLEGEKVVLSFKGQIPVVIVRISETFGPGDRRLLKLFKAIKKRVFFIIGSGANLHHLLYIDDLVEGLLLAGASQATAGETFVLAGKDVLSTREMADTIARVLGTRISSLRAPLWPFLLVAVAMEGVLRPLGVQPPLHRRRMDFFRKSFTFDQTRGRTVLGYVPKWGFEQGIVETAKWYTEMGLL